MTQSHRDPPRGGMFLIDPVGSHDCFTEADFGPTELEYAGAAEDFVKQEVLPILDRVEAAEPVLSRLFADLVLATTSNTPRSGPFSESILAINEFGIPPHRAVAGGGPALRSGSHVVAPMVTTIPVTVVIHVVVMETVVVHVVIVVAAVVANILTMSICIVAVWNAVPVAVEILERVVLRPGETPVIRERDRSEIDPSLATADVEMVILESTARKHHVPGKVHFRLAVEMAESENVPIVRRQKKREPPAAPVDIDLSHGFPITGRPDPEIIASGVFD